MEFAGTAANRAGRPGYRRLAMPEPAPDRASHSFRLAADLQAAGAARRAVDQVERDIDPQLRDDVRLLVSEIVTNSVRHAHAESGAEIDLVISPSHGSVRIIIADRGAGFEPPAPRGFGELRPAGWGLQLIDALASRWGVESDAGVTVWFELDRPGGQGP